MTPVVAVAVVLFSAARWDCEVWKKKVEPEVIQADIRSRGLWFVYRELTCDNDVWDKVIAGVETGTPAWLNVALALSKMADGGAAEDLGWTLSELLAKQPRSVLDLIYRSKASAGSKEGALDVEFICGNYEVVTTREEANRLLKAQEDGVSAIHDGKLRSIRERCLKAIGEARKTLPNAQFPK
jgi:hypothetical protein